MSSVYAIPCIFNVEELSLFGVALALVYSASVLALLISLLTCRANYKTHFSAGGKF